MLIGICGAGTMGAGIAIAAIQNGHNALLFDIQQTSRERGEAFIIKQIDKAVARNLMTREAADAALENYSFTDKLEDFASCEIVIEAVVERRDVKDELFAKLEGILPETAILATNTSSISIASLAAELRHPERFIGMHFFNPAHIMKLVEVIRGPKTHPEVVEKTVALAKSMRKSPAVAADVPGFIVNRVARNFYNEAQRICTERTATIEQVDTLMKNAGFRMGPFELMDLIGVDTNLEVTKSVWAQYFNEPRFQPSLMQQQYVDAKMWGRKTGEGFYKYDQDGNKVAR